MDEKLEKKTKKNKWNPKNCNKFIKIPRKQDVAKSNC